MGEQVHVKKMESELRNMFGDNDIMGSPHFLGGSMTAKLGYDLVMDLAFGGSNGPTFYGFKLNIFNRLTGDAIVSKYIPFVTIIGLVDDGKGNPISPTYSSYEGKWNFDIQDYERWEIADSVIGYVSVFK